jgi:hypothetical protein
MGIRDEHAARERGAWAAFMDLVATVPADRIDERTVVPGWSVKDLIWHDAGWASFAADALETSHGASFLDPFGAHAAAHWDAVSEEMIERGRSLTLDEVLSRAEAQRAHVHDVWSGLPQPGAEAAAWFAEETFLHYEEHAAEVRAWKERA